MITSTEVTSAPASLALRLEEPATIEIKREPMEAASSQREMRLADFILENRAAILAEWHAFAKTCAPASGSMGIAALSDHASEMLTVIAADLKTPQDAYEQSEKSKGHAVTTDTDERTAAEKHGTGRAASGF